MHRLSKKEEKAHIKLISSGCHGPSQKQIKNNWNRKQTEKDKDISCYPKKSKCSCAKNVVTLD